MYFRGLGTASPAHSHSQAECLAAFEQSSRFKRLAPRAHRIARRFWQRDKGMATGHLAVVALDEVVQFDADTLDNDPGMLINAGLFGDGAGAAVLSHGPQAGRLQVEWAHRAWLIEPAQRQAPRSQPRLIATGRPGPRWDLIICSLFLHHFDGDALRSLRAAVAQRSDRFITIEPRRCRLALRASRAVGLIGANAVTRPDAVISVQAGFQGQELQAAWPDPGRAWQLHQSPVGLFSHCLLGQASGSPS